MIKEVFDSLDSFLEIDEIHIFTNDETIEKLQLTTESIWVDSKIKDFWYRIDPSNPSIPLQRHIHIARKKHINSKTQQVSWNVDGSRHDKKNFNNNLGNNKKVRQLAQDILGLDKNITLESIENSNKNHLLIEYISSSSDGKIIYLYLKE